MFVSGQSTWRGARQDGGKKKEKKGKKKTKCKKMLCVSEVCMLYMLCKYKDEREEYTGIRTPLRPVRRCYPRRRENSL